MPLTNEQIQELLALTQTPQQRGPQPDIFYRHGFDRSCLFLLEMRWDNLFEPYFSKGDEPISKWPNEWWFRCKGCRRMVKRIGRESHFNWHKRELMT